MFPTTFVTTNNALNISMIFVRFGTFQALRVSQMSRMWQPDKFFRIGTQTGQRLTDWTDGIRSGWHHIGVPPDGTWGRSHQSHGIQQNFGAGYVGYWEIG